MAAASASRDVASATAGIAAPAMTRASTVTIYPRVMECFFDKLNHVTDVICVEHINAIFQQLDILLFFAFYLSFCLSQLVHSVCTNNDFPSVILFQHAHCVVCGSENAVIEHFEPDTGKGREKLLFHSTRLKQEVDKRVVFGWNRVEA